MHNIEKLEKVVDRFREVEGLLSDPKTIADQEKYRSLTKEHSELSGVVETYAAYRQVEAEIVGNRELLQDPDLGEIAKAELPALEEQQAKLVEQQKKIDDSFALAMKGLDADTEASMLEAKGNWDLRINKANNEFQEALQN